MKVILKMANGHKETFLNVRQVITTNECDDAMADVRKGKPDNDGGYYEGFRADLTSAGVSVN